MIDKNNVVRILNLDENISDDDLQDKLDEFLLKFKSELVTKPPLVKLLMSKIKRLNALLLEKVNFSYKKEEIKLNFSSSQDFIAYLKNYQVNTSKVKLNIYQSLTVNELINAINSYILIQTEYNEALCCLLKFKNVLEVEFDDVKASELINDLILIKYLKNELSVEDKLLMNREFCKIKKRLDIEKI